MFSNNRLQYIIEQLEKNGSVRLTELIRDLDVSESTIRRDIQELHNLGLLRRVHGGAVSTEQKYLIADKGIRERSSLYKREKMPSQNLLPHKFRTRS